MPMWARAMFSGRCIWLCIFFCTDLQQPFVDADHFIHSCFPPRHYAILVPTALGVGLLTVIVSFIALVMINAKKTR